jgi:large subunit ribosomal protein L28
MAYACDITGKSKQFGNSVPFSQKKTRKVWKPNLQPMTVMVGGQKVRLKVAASTIRTLKKWEREEAAKHAHGAHKAEAAADASLAAVA